VTQAFGFRVSGFEFQVSSVVWGSGGFAAYRAESLRLSVVAF